MRAKNSYLASQSFNLVDYNDFCLGRESIVVHSDYCLTKQRLLSIGGDLLVLEAVCESGMNHCTSSLGAK